MQNYSISVYHTSPSHTSIKAGRYKRSQRREQSLLHCLYFHSLNDGILREVFLEFTMEYESQCKGFEDYLFSKEVC
jgi:hypothetical protein